MLKFNLSESEFENVSSDIQAFYKKNDSGYVLQVSGIEDTGALKRAKQHEAEARKAAETRVRELETRISSLESGTDDRVSTLQAELDGTKETLGAEVSKYRGMIEQSELNRVALDLAGKISTAPSVILPHIKARLSPVFDKDGKLSVSVTGSDGKVSTATLEDLGKEFIANSDFSAIVKGSSSSGGAGTRTNPASGVQIPKQVDNAKNPAQMNARELAEWTAERRAAREASQE